MDIENIGRKLALGGMAKHAMSFIYPVFVQDAIQAKVSDTDLV